MTTSPEGTPMNDTNYLFPHLRNGRGRIRCYWCKWDSEEPSGPWAITTEYLMDADGYVGLCYDHSDIPHQKYIKELQQKRIDKLAETC